MAHSTPYQTGNYAVVIRSDEIYFTAYTVDQDKPAGTIMRPSRTVPYWRAYALDGSLIKATKVGPYTCLRAIAAHNKH